MLSGEKTGFAEEQSASSMAMPILMAMAFWESYGDFFYLGGSLQAFLWLRLRFSILIAFEKHRVTPIL